ncbi:MAG: SDR family oxidoreductase [Chloroflexi bacterium]|nr:SDR family oxidoreductase [Chloroflexota bacterium]
MALDRQVALVTGAGSGIGRASALALARQGLRVAAVDRDLAAAEAVRQQMAAAGGTALALTVDVADSAAVDAMVAQAGAALGSPDLLVHCAGIAPRQAVLDMSDHEWRQVMAVNLDGTFYVARAVGRVMAERRAGTMIFLASDRGLYGHARGAHYAASKGGVIALMKSLALELAAHGVTVNAINPGTTDTPMSRATLSDDEWQRRAAQDPLGRLSRPEEIAELVCFLAGPGGHFMTGQLVTVRMRFG